MACDPWKAILRRWNCTKDRSEQKLPLQLHTLGKVLLSLGPWPQLPHRNPLRPSMQDPPCQEALSHPLIPNLPLSLNFLHLSGGRRGRASVG